jgi:hypothetical protein
LQGAIQKGLTLEPATLAALARLQKSALVNPFDAIRARSAMKTLSIIIAITATTIVARSEALDDYALSTLHWVEAAPVPPGPPLEP